MRVCFGRCQRSPPDTPTCWLSDILAWYSWMYASCGTTEQYQGGTWDDRTHEHSTSAGRHAPKTHAHAHMQTVCTLPAHLREALPGQRQQLVCQQLHHLGREDVQDGEGPQHVAAVLCRGAVEEEGEGVRCGGTRDGEMNEVKACQCCLPRAARPRRPRACPPAPWGCARRRCGAARHARRRRRACRPAWTPPSTGCLAPGT